MEPGDTITAKPEPDKCPSGDPEYPRLTSDDMKYQYEQKEMKQKKVVRRMRIPMSAILRYLKKYDLMALDLDQKVHVVVRVMGKEYDGHSADVIFETRTVEPLAEDEPDDGKD